jgi:hypothetical protein
MGLMAPDALWPRAPSDLKGIGLPETLKRGPDE